MPGPEEMSRDELLVVVDRQAGQLAEQAGQLAAQDRQIAGMAGQLAELMEANEALAAKLARLEHLLSRNSGNSSSPPSRTTARVSPRRRRSPGVAGRGRRGRGVSSPARRDRIWRGPTPRTSGARCSRQGRCDCGADLADAADLGVVDRYQQHEIPQVAVTVTQYDQHQVECGCGKIHTAARPEGARPGPVGYGPNLAAFAVYLMVVHFVPAHRVVALLESLTGTAPSVGFVHGLLARTAGLLGEVHDRIRALITLAYAVSLRRNPAQGRAAHPEAGPEEGRQVPAGGLHRAVHPLPARRPVPGHVHGVRAHRTRRARRRSSCTTATRTTTAPSSPG